MKKVFAPFNILSKAEDDECIVEGYASTEALDSQGEIVTQKAMESALPEWLKFGNIREMHQPSAVGVAMSADHDGVGVRLRAKIVDANARKKVEAGVYKGFSIGGKVTNRDKVNKSVITGLHLTEISIVDRPANPEALFDVWKADGVQPEEVASLDTPAAGEAEIAKGMWSVARLAEILTQIQSTAQESEWEKEFEGDDSTMPDALKAWLKQGGQLLVQMAAEETSEMTGEDTPSVEVIALAEAAADLAKGGKRNSKADQKKLNDAHAAIVSAGADCGGAMKHDATGDLAKAADELAAVKGELTKAQDDLAKASTDFTEMQDKLNKADADRTAAQTALDAMIKARTEAEDSLSALTKSLDTVTTERSDLAKRNEELATDLAAIKSTADALKAEVETLKSAPEPMKGKLLVVGKGEDVSDAKTEVSGVVTKSAVTEAEERPWFTARGT